MLLAQVTAFGEDTGDVERPSAPFEAVAFGAYRGGGTFDIEGSEENADVAEHVSLALAFDYKVDEQSAYQLFFSRQSTKVTAGGEQTGLLVKYFMVGGTLGIEDMSRVHPYVAGLVGLARFSLDEPGARDDSRFAISVGVGMRMPLREQFDLRVEGRGYVTFLDSDSSLFCQSGGAQSGCLLRGNGSTFVQFELLAGLAWSF